MITTARSPLVGNVISGWNAFRDSGPMVISRAVGPYVWDEAGNQYIDWIMGWGSLLLGHNPASVRDAVIASFQDGFGYQYESPRGRELATQIVDMVPGAERVRLANSGTEATLHAVRLARAATGRRKIVKFEGHFHGLNDYLMFGIDSGTELGKLSAGRIDPVEGSHGLPVESLRGLVDLVEFNDAQAVERVLREEAADIAAIILEPIAMNIGVIRPDDGFLQHLRQLCDELQVVLIFDEVITGFRAARGGAQERFGVIPDLVTLGKALGCGLPTAAVAGKAEIMDLLTPVGPVQMAGTNTGRQATVAGSLAALRELDRPGFYESLNELNDITVNGLVELFDRYSVPAYVEGYGGRIGIMIGAEERPRTYRQIVDAWNEEYHLSLYRECLSRRLFGFLLPLSVCPEPVTLSACHTREVIEETLSRLEDALKATPYREPRR